MRGPAGVGGQGGQVAQGRVAFGQGCRRVGEQAGVALGDQGLVEFDEHLPELERRGLVVRVTDPDDQRARLIELTADGAAAAGRYLDTVLGWFTGAVADWSDEDRQTFGRLLGRFVDDLTARIVDLDGPNP